MDNPLDSVRVITHSAIRLAASDGTAIYADPYDLHDDEAAHDASYLLITHPHYDHLSPEDAARVMNDGTEVIAPVTVKDDLAALGEVRSHLMRAGEVLELGSITVEAVAAYNTDPTRLQKHPRERGWLGYIVTMDGVRYYVSGDTDENEDVDRVSCDVALVPIGGTFTMDPHQAAAYVNAICPRAAVPTHYGNIVGSYADFDAFAAEVNPAINVVRKLER